MYSDVPGDGFRGPPPYSDGDNGDPFLGPPSPYSVGGDFPGGPRGPSGAYGAAGYSDAPGMYSGAARDFVEKRRPRPAYFHTMSLCLLIFLPSGIFVAISLFMALLFHQARAACWTLGALCLGVSFLLMAVRNGRTGPNYWFNLGALCFIATATGGFTGLWNYERSFGVYWAYEGQREYTNVLPSEPALNHLDAGRIEFSSDAQLDLSKTVGYKDGKTFCVAPIVSSSHPSSRVEFWAAGVDCCGDGNSSNFSCGSADNQEAHAGLVYLDSRPFRKSNVEKFQMAASEAVAKHGLASSPDALFVQWVQYPEKAQRSYWRSGVGFLVASAFIYLAISVVVGFSFHFGRGSNSPRSQRAKLQEGRNV